MLARDPSIVPLTPVQQRVAHEIVALMRRRGQVAGAQLTELEVAHQLGTSRSPVRAALHYLIDCGVLRRDATHGLVLTKDAADWTAVASRFSLRPEDSFYALIADERRMGLLDDVVTEAELMRRFGVARSTLRKVLVRISDEGWIEQRVGRGWGFLPMIDSADAYRESHAFLQAIEPWGLLSPTFQFVLEELAELRGEQQRIADCEGHGMTAMELFDADSRFHEALARWSNNRFILQSVRRVNSLRRSFQTLQASATRSFDARALDYLAILDAIESLDMAVAVRLLRAHLESVAGGIKRSSPGAMHKSLFR